MQKVAICNHCRYFVGERCRHDQGRTSTVFYAEACGLAEPEPAPAQPAIAIDLWHTPPSPICCPKCSSTHVKINQTGRRGCWSCKHQW